MDIHVLSAYQTTAEEFFDKIIGWKTDLVLDIRLRNTNQLAGFTKQEDLEYFTHVIAHADYVHDVEYSPSRALLNDYLDHGLPYEEYFARYAKEMEERQAIPAFFQKYGKYRSVAIIGTATNKRRSHAEELQRLLEAAEQKRRGTSQEDNPLDSIRPTSQPMMPPQIA